MRLRSMRHILLCVLCAVPFFAAAPRPAEEHYTLFDEMPLYERLDRYEKRRYEGLRYLMNDHQKYQYLNLPTRSERDEWVLKFWRMRDPTPATRVNERREEHEKRVEEARARYPKDGFPGWDHRGEALIRYGEPDAIEEIPGNIGWNSLHEVTMPGEVWQYFKLGMVIPFEDVKLNGECVYYLQVRSAYTRYPHQMLTDDYGDALEAMNYSGANVYNLFFAASPELLKFYALLEDNRCVHSADVDIVPLLCYFDVTEFRGGPGKVRADVNLEIPARELAFCEDLSGWHAKFEVKVAAYDIDMNQVLAASRDVDLSRREPVPKDSLWLYPAQLNLSIEPGYYRWGLEVIDRAGGKHGRYSFSRMLEPIGGGLSLSDILFASSIRPAADEKAFVRGTLRVVPHPVHAYRKPQPVRFYFEIYGLDTDQQGFAFYSIEYRIEAKQKHRVGPVMRKDGAVISPRFETSAYGSTQSERLEVDTEKLHEGSYRLFVTVMDRRTRETVEKVANFSILE